MFVVKSVAWFTVAFMVIKPGFDLQQAAQDGAAGAAALGRGVVVEAILPIECDTLSCAGTKAAALALLAPISNPSVGSPMHDSPTDVLAPVPRPRLDRTG